MKWDRTTVNKMLCDYKKQLNTEDLKWIKKN
jgi:hypothetical protein